MLFASELGQTAPILRALMGLYLGVRWYPRWTFQSWVAKFPGVVVGLLRPEENSPPRHSGAMSQRERLWKAHQMQWIIEMIALLSNQKHVFSICLGSKVPGKPASSSDGHLTSMLFFSP